MKFTIIVLSLAIALTNGAPSPGGIVYTAFPAPSSDTKVVRDGLGNQATSYAYQDGHSSAVALSRSDVSKHLVAVPAPAPIVYSPAVSYQHALPAYEYAAHGPAYSHPVSAYSHQVPAYAHQIPAYSHPAPYHPYAGAEFADPAYYY